MGILLTIATAVLLSCTNNSDNIQEDLKSADNTTYSRSSLIADVISDPSLGEYGRLIFPVQTSYWSGSTLEQLRLTYYNYIDPNMTVEIVNYMKRHAVEGEVIFYDIYSESEKQSDADKRNTGLFFFKGQQGAPFAVCNAGGAFAYVGAMHDSFPHALSLSKKGYNAFALIYRTGNAYEDLARAIEFIYDHADRLGVSQEGYSLWGGSAGARMVAVLGNSNYMRQLTRRHDIPQAAAVVMQYTAIQMPTVMMLLLTYAWGQVMALLRGALCKVGSNVLKHLASPQSFMLTEICPMALALVLAPRLRDGLMMPSDFGSGSRAGHLYQK